MLKKWKELRGKLTPERQARERSGNAAYARRDRARGEGGAEAMLRSPQRNDRVIINRNIQPVLIMSVKSTEGYEEDLRAWKIALLMPPGIIDHSAYVRSVPNIGPSKPGDTTTWEVIAVYKPAPGTPCD